MREKALSLREAETQIAGIKTLLQWPLWLPVPGPAWDSLTGWEAVLFSRVEMDWVLSLLRDGGWRVTKILHDSMTGIL